jgi:hypothetical protein
MSFADATKPSLPVVLPVLLMPVVQILTRTQQQAFCSATVLVYLSPFSAFCHFLQFSCLHSSAEALVLLVLDEGGYDM